jgi:hypothetical protein
MDSQWQSYGNLSSGAHLDNSAGSNPYRLDTKYNGQQQTQPPAGYTYESYQSPITAAQTSAGGSTSKSVSMASSPAATPHTRDYFTDADTPMEDADPYNRAKYSTRLTHNTRPASQYMPTEESSAARRYSPMNILSPTLPYSSSPTKPVQNPFVGPPSGPGSSRQSPTRASAYTSPPHAYQSPPGMSIVFCPGLTDHVGGAANELIIWHRLSRVSIASFTAIGHEPRTISSFFGLFAIECPIQHRNKVAAHDSTKQSQTITWPWPDTKIHNHQIDARA